MAITETWLHEHISDDVINITGFQPIFRRDRPLNRQGGGVCFFVSTEQPAQRRNDLEHLELELLGLEIRPNPLRSGMRRRRPLLVGCCYRPPNSTIEFFEHLEFVLDKITDMDMILQGDFNAKHQEWFYGRFYKCSWCFYEGLDGQIIYVPAMLSTNTLEFRRSLLDLVLTNIPDLLSLSPLVDVMAPIGRSDHLPVVVQSAPHLSSNIPDAISSHPDPVIARTKWLFHQQDGEKKLDAFLLENWTHVFCGEGRYQRNQETLEGTVLSRHQIIHWVRN